MSPASALTGDRYVLKKRLLRLLADGFSIQDDAGREVLSARQKRFRLREDIRLQDSTGQEVLGIFARSIIDFAASYDVVDLASDARLGTFRRREIRSLVRDTWELTGPEGEPWGGIVEDSVALSLVRRFATSLVPQRYDLTADGQKVADLSQNFNPFTYHLQIDFHVPPPAFDRRLGLAGAVLLGVFEGRQSREG